MRPFLATLPLLALAGVLAQGPVTANGATKKQHIGNDEFAMNFANGKASDKNYRGVHSPDLRFALARIVTFEDDSQGLEVKSKQDDAFAVFNVQRDLGASWSAQLRIHWEGGQPGALAGIERDVRDQQGNLTDFLFAGTSWNPSINGITAFVNINGVNVGTPLNLPNITCASVAIVQLPGNTRVFAKPDADPQFHLVGEWNLPTPPLSHLGMGVSRLAKGRFVGLSDLFIKGDVTGTPEGDFIGGGDFIRDNLSDIYEGLAGSNPDKPGAVAALTVQLTLLRNLQTQNNDNIVDDVYQGSTLADEAGDNLTKAIKKVEAAIKQIQDGKTDKSLKPLASALRRIELALLNIRGIAATKETDVRLLIPPRFSLQW